MKKLLFTFLLSLVMGLNWGCKDKDDASKVGAVGVVDLAKVAKSVGWSDEMAQSAQKAQNQYRAQADAFLKPSKDAFEHKQEEIVKDLKLTPDQFAAMKKATQVHDLEVLGLKQAQIDELMKLAVAFSQEANAAKTQMNQVMQTHQQAMVQSCAQLAEPAIRRVAAANHRTVVLTPGGNLLFSDPAADLTDKVIDDLQHSALTKLTMPEPPRLDLHSSSPPATPSR